MRDDRSDIDNFHNQGGFNPRQGRQQGFDISDLVLKKIRDLKERFHKPVSLNTLNAEFGQKMSRAELIDILRSLQEMGEIRQINGSELSYDLY